MIETINPESKKIFSVAFSLVLGLGIILFAWKIGSPTNDISSKPNDSTNGSLVAIPQGGTQTLGYNSSNTNGGLYEATTTTDYVAQQIVLNSMLKEDENSTATFENPDPGALAQELAQAALTDPNMKKYTEADLLLTTDSSAAAFNTYKENVINALKTLIKENPVNEILVISTAIGAKDQAALAPLAVSVKANKNFLKTILAIKVPPAAVKAHLTLVQAYYSMLSGEIDIQQIITDPLLGMRGTAKYKYGLSLLSEIGKGTQ